MLGICRYHRNANGWNDIGYNALVDRFGTLYAGPGGRAREGRSSAPRRRASTPRPRAIASIGDPHRASPISPEAQGLDRQLPRLEAVGPRAQRDRQDDPGLGRRRAQPLSGGRRVRLNKVIGHRDVGLTACPGDALELEMPHDPPDASRLAIERVRRSDRATHRDPPPDDGDTARDGGVTRRAALGPVGGEEAARVAAVGRSRRVGARVADDLVGEERRARRWRSRA